MNVMTAHLPPYIWFLGISAIVFLIMFWPVSDIDKNKFTTALSKFFGYVAGAFFLLVIWLIYFVFN